MAGERCEQGRGVPHLHHSIDLANGKHARPSSLRSATEAFRSARTQEFGVEAPQRDAARRPVARYPEVHELGIAGCWAEEDRTGYYLQISRGRGAGG
jgi:hypothetical protein